MNSDWLTPEQLAQDMGRPVRFVKEQMASGAIPSIKIGGRRYFTPECRAALMASQLAAPPQPAAPATNEWSLVTRGAS